MSRPWFEAQPEIARCLAGGRDILLFLKFGGVVAPIAADQALAVPSTLMLQTLQAMTDSGRVAVAVISGRERADLQARIGLPGLIYAGNHGLEISGPGFLFVEPTAVSHRTAIQGLAEDLTNRLRSFPGVIVDDKGLTVNVHYREAAAEAHEMIRQHVHGALANSSHPFHLITGDMVYEVHPRLLWTKSKVVSWVREQLGKPEALIVYLGSDTADEEAFGTLADAVTIKVGEGDTAAKYRAADAGEVQGFLVWLRDAVRAS